MADYIGSRSNLQSTRMLKILFVQKRLSRRLRCQTLRIDLQILNSANHTKLWPQKHLLQHSISSLPRSPLNVTFRITVHFRNTYEGKKVETPKINLRVNGNNVQMSRNEESFTIKNKASRSEISPTSFGKASSIFWVKVSIMTAFPRKAATKNSAESLDAVFLCLSSPFSSLHKEKKSLDVG